MGNIAKGFSGSSLDGTTKLLIVKAVASRFQNHPYCALPRFRHLSRVQARPERKTMKIKLLLYLRHVWICEGKGGRSGCHRLLVKE